MEKIIFELRKMAANAKKEQEEKERKATEDICLDFIEKNIKPVAAQGGTRTYLTICPDYNKANILNWFRNKEFKAELSGGTLTVDWSE